MSFCFIILRYDKYDVDFVELFFVDVGELCLSIETVFLLREEVSVLLKAFLVVVFFLGLLGFTCRSLLAQRLFSRFWRK